MTLLERFQEKVDRRRPDECWPWKAGTDRWRYGRISDQGVNRTAHTVAYELLVGEIPKGMCVCHTCDNPPCTNPRHLFIGTHNDNVQDKMSKGRHVVLSGEKHGRSKLTEERVATLRRECVKGSRTHGIRAFARKYGVDKKTITDALSGRHWH